MKMEAEKKTYSAEEIAKIAPRYKGKPENFDPTRFGKRREPPKQKNKGHKYEDGTKFGENG
jgi:hypothetical protein